MKIVTTNKVCWFLSLNHNRHNLNGNLMGNKKLVHMYIRANGQWKRVDGYWNLCCNHWLKSWWHLCCNLFRNPSGSIFGKTDVVLCWCCGSCVLSLSLYMYIYIYIYIDVQTYYVIPNTKNEWYQCVAWNLAAWDAAACGEIARILCNVIRFLHYQRQK